MDAVVSASSPTVVQSVSCLESKIRVLSLNGVSGTPGHHVLNVASAGEPVLLGNILLVPETPTVKLQVLSKHPYFILKSHPYIYIYMNNKRKHDFVILCIISIRSFRKMEVL